MHSFEVEQSHRRPRAPWLDRADSTLLLVDDDHIVLRVLQAVLTHEGYNVLTAATPERALDLAGRCLFHMLITDFQMPEMTGFALACRLAASHGALPVLLVSGSDLDDLPMPEIAARRWNFLPKPLDRTRLLRVVDGECLGGTNPLGSNRAELKTA